MKEEGSKRSNPSANPRIRRRPRRWIFRRNRQCVPSVLPSTSFPTPRCTQIHLPSAPHPANHMPPSKPSIQSSTFIFQSASFPSKSLNRI
ncbi:hypothetical protein ACLOJK_018713 [Asimina triloba]